MSNPTEAFDFGFAKANELIKKYPGITTVELKARVYIAWFEHTENTGRGNVWSKGARELFTKLYQVIYELEVDRDPTLKQINSFKE